MAESLRLALVHAELVHGDPGANRAELLRLNRQAARQGAQVVLNTEMATTGYGFQSRSEIAPLVEADDGQTLGLLGRIASEYGLYLGLGMAERDKATGLFYNSAFLLGPDGRVTAKRRKVTTEPKWAAPGELEQPDTALTPWGRLGLLVCSETYYSLAVRAMALKGVDLVLAPANWPESGLRTGDLWRSRAMENGIHLAVCNRAGSDPGLDLATAHSSVHDGEGRRLLHETSEKSKVFIVDIPLVKGRLDSALRLERLAGRNPGAYDYLGADLSTLRDFTTFYHLPRPGELRLHCLALKPDSPEAWEWIERKVMALAGEGLNLFILPEVRDPAPLRRLGRMTGAGCLASLGKRNGMPAMGLADGNGLQLLENRPDKGEPLILDMWPARLGLVSAEDLCHPEWALVHAKRGCDLVAASAGVLDEWRVPVLAMRSLDQVAVAVAYENGGLISLPAGAHEHPTQAFSTAPGSCSLTLDTALTREKSFRELVGIRLLLAARKAACRA